MAKRTIGEFLAILRKSKGYTQQQVAEMLGVSNRTVSVWETDRAYPDILTLPAIADIYGVTVDEILKGERNAAAWAEGCTEISEESQKKLYSRALSAASTKNTVLVSCGIAGYLMLFVVSLIGSITAIPVWAAVLFPLLSAAIFFAVCSLYAVFYKRSLQNAAIYPDDKGLSGVQKRFALILAHNTLTSLMVTGAIWFFGGLIILAVGVGIVKDSASASVFVYTKLTAFGAASVLFPVLAGGAVWLFAVIANSVLIKKRGIEDDIAVRKANGKLFAKCFCIAACPVIVLSVLIIFNVPHMVSENRLWILVSVLAIAVIIAVAALVYFAKRKKNELMF